MGDWERYVKYLVRDEAQGFALDISRMRFPESLFDDLRPAIESAFAAMRDLEAGKIANPDEDRMVGHYWLRAPELAPNPEIHQEIRETQVAISAFATAVHTGAIAPERANRFKNLLLIGIGGSALGPQLVADALGHDLQQMRIYFLDNTDPDGMERVFAQIESGLPETLTVVASKSGGTKETRNGMLEAEFRYRAAGLDFGKHAAAITGVGSELDRHAETQGWIHRFPMWDWVGGRTSVMSAVGLLPAALLGFDTAGLLRGAAEMDVWTRTPDARRNPAALLALMWHHAGGGHGEKDMVVLPYRDRLALMAKYLQQLVMESLGKELDLQGRVVNQGIVVYGNKGSTDQHAYVQQLREGANNFFATFIEVLNDGEGGEIEVQPGVRSGDYLQGFYLGTRTALAEKDRESMTITLERLDAAALGRLIALFERAVGLYASLIGINAYHQPGVEAGKKAAEKVIALQAKALAALSSTPATAAEIAASAGEPPSAETVYHVLRRLSSNPFRGVKRESGETPADDRFLTA